MIKLNPLKEVVTYLIELYTKSGEAADKLNDAIKATAEKTGLMASVIRKYVVARAGESYEERKRDADQLSLVFEEVGLLGGTKG